jgi:hypothetical protein
MKEFEMPMVNFLANGVAGVGMAGAAAGAVVAAGAAGAVVAAGAAGAVVAAGAVGAVVGAAVGAVVAAGAAGAVVAAGAAGAAVGAAVGAGAHAPRSIEATVTNTTSIIKGLSCFILRFLLFVFLVVLMPFDYYWEPRFLVRHIERLSFTSPHFDRIEFA